MIALHLAILLFGAAALVAQASQLSPLALTLGRCLVAAPLLLGLAWRSAPALAASWLDLRRLAVAGALLALHWFSFFLAMRRGGVPLALLSYASFPAFSLLLERVWAPAELARRTPPRRAVLQLALLGGGLLLLAGGGGGAPAGRSAGLLWGLLAGACFAVLTRWNADQVGRQGALRLAGGQLAGAALILLPLAGGELLRAGLRDWLLLLLLGCLCTALGHGLFIRALRRVGPFQAALAAGLEPVYGLLLAAALGLPVLPREWAALPLVAGAALLGCLDDKDGITPG